MLRSFNLTSFKVTQIARFMGPTWGPPGSCRPQMGPMLAQWTLLSGNIFILIQTPKAHFNIKTIFPATGIFIINGRWQMTRSYLNIGNIYNGKIAYWYRNNLHLSMLSMQCINTHSNIPHAIIEFLMWLPQKYDECDKLFSKWIYSIRSKLIIQKKFQKLNKINFF